MRSMCQLLFLWCLIVPSIVLAADHPQGDCCWGEGCSQSAGIHQAETEQFPPGCSNNNAGAGIGTQRGTCSNDYVGPSFNQVTCDEEGCYASGKLRCPNSSGLPPTHPFFVLDCPNKTVGGTLVMPFVNITQTIAVCAYADGHGEAHECGPAGSMISTSF